MRRFQDITETHLLNRMQLIKNKDYKDKLQIA